ncbi:hypothetical protein [Corynebacterium striatum]|uniref:hypothetical protein n=1 Tax=Corynebacterium striatum TaxID=43770 RepID=UPI0011B61ABC|nr:hypothetical protein [Corynebacterium striatum]
MAVFSKVDGPKEFTIGSCMQAAHTHGYNLILWAMVESPSTQVNFDVTVVLRALELVQRAKAACDF